MSLTAALTNLAEAKVEAVAAVRGPCDIRIVADRSAFDALEAPWSDLFDKVARPDQVFQSFNWLWHWANHFLDARVELALITGWRAGRLVMVWPLVRTRVAGVRVLRWMGEPASQYGDVLVEPGPHAGAMLCQGLEILRTMDVDLALLRKVRRTATVSGLLATEGLSTACSKAPRLDFAEAQSFAEVERQFSAKDRSSRRRLGRRLAETGQVAFEDRVEGARAAALTLQAIALKLANLKASGQCSPALEQAATQAFFADAMSSVERPVGAMINAIVRDGRPIGVALSLVCKGEGFGHILAHDSLCDKQGVGVLLAEQVFRSAHRRGLGGFDMLAPADCFKLKWASSVAKLDDWVVPLNRRGRWFVRLWVAQVPRLKRLAEASPAWLGSPVWWAYRRMKQRPSPPAPAPAQRA